MIFGLVGRRPAQNQRSVRFKPVHKAQVGQLISVLHLHSGVVLTLENSSQ